MSEVASSTKSRRSLQVTAVALSAGAVLVGGMALGATGATAASPTDECEGSGSTSYDKIEYPGTTSGDATITYTNDWSGTWATGSYAVRVVVKSGSQSNPSVTGVPGYSGTWTTGSEKEQDLSHITFCYGTEATTPPPTTPPPTTPPPTTPPPTTAPPTTTPPTTPPATTPPAATTAAATTPAPVVTATPLPAEVTAAPLPAEITAEPSAAKVEKPEVSAKPLPASVPAGGGGDSGGGTPPWAPALVLLGGLGLVLSTGWLAVKR